MKSSKKSENEKKYRKGKHYKSRFLSKTRKFQMYGKLFCSVVTVVTTKHRAAKRYAPRRRQLEAGKPCSHISNATRAYRPTT